MIEQHCQGCKTPTNPRLCRQSCKADWLRRTEKEKEEKPLHFIKKKQVTT